MSSKTKTNAQILLKEIIDAKVKESDQTDRSTIFELFCTEQILKGYELDAEEYRKWNNWGGE